MSSKNNHIYLMPLKINKNIPEFFQKKKKNKWDATKYIFICQSIESPTQSHTGIGYCLPPPKTTTKNEFLCRRRRRVTTQLIFGWKKVSENTDMSVLSAYVHVFHCWCCWHCCCWRSSYGFIVNNKEHINELNGKTLSFVNISISTSQYAHTQTHTHGPLHTRVHNTHTHMFIIRYY